MRSAWGVIAPLIIGVLLGWSVYQGILNDRQGHALCTLRGDLEKRVEASNQFLRDHPKGIPGIPAATLRQSIDGQRRTISALHDLSC